MLLLLLIYIVAKLLEWPAINVSVKGYFFCAQAIALLANGPGKRKKKIKATFLNQYIVK